MLVRRITKILRRLVNEDGNGLMLNLSLDLSFETAGERAVLWQMSRTRSLISAQAAGKIYRPSLQHRTRTQDEDRDFIEGAG